MSALLRLLSSLLACLPTSAACVSATGEEEPAARPPDVVLIVADDLGWGDVGWHGSAIPTPNLDRLAAESLRLRHFYVQPMCSPTRAGLLTGVMPVRLGVQYSVVRPWSDFGLDPDQPLLSELLREAGYRTAIVGKWHLGHRRAEDRPLARGFDHFYGHLTSVVDYFEHHYVGTLDWQRNGQSLIEEGYKTELIAEEALRVIAETPPDRPLFLYVPFGAPHAPLQAPEERIAAIEGIVDEKRRTFAAMVATLDEGVGRILAGLEEAGRGDDALVIFLSDNGGEPTLGAANGELRGGKGRTFEGGVRVPALVRYRAALPGGRDVEAVLSFLDVTPTVLSLAGVEASRRDPPLVFDGHDVWPVLAEGARSPHDELFFAIEHRKWTEAAVRTREWKLVRIARPPGSQPVDHLFRIDEDPREERNVAADHPERVRELTQRIEAWRALHPEGGVHYERKAPQGFQGLEDFNRSD